MGSPAVDRLLDLSGKVALITGAGKGIGAAVARRFAEAGAAVAVHYRFSEGTARQVVDQIESRGGNAEPVGGDLADPESVARVVEGAARAFGRLDILVNNVGAYPVGDFGELDLEDWQDVYASNVESTFLCTQAAAQQMRAGGGGVIVNVASVSGLVPAPGQAHYSSAKAAVVALTRATAQALAGDGIRVNCVSPGLIRRPGIEEEWPEGVAAWLARSPLPRLGDPDDVADACLYLASPAARWITGHNLVVDGGMLAAPAY